MLVEPVILDLGRATVRNRYLPISTIRRTSVKRHLQYWLAIGNDVRLEARRDHAVIIAAGVAFYAVLALLPAMFIAVTFYGLFTSVADAERQIDGLLTVLPKDAASLLDAQLSSIASGSSAGLTLGFALSLAAFLWTVSNATRAMIGAVKIAYDQEEHRSVLESRLVAIGLTFFVIGGGVLVLAMIAAVPLVLQRFDPTDAIVTISNVRWLVIGGGTVLVTALLYRYAPPIQPDGWRDVLPGAILATALWSVASIGFSVYVSSYGSYNATYGALGAAVVLLLWFWISALSVILGAEFNDAVVRHRRSDTRI